MNIALFTFNLVDKNKESERTLGIAITGTVLPVLTFHVAVFQISSGTKNKLNDSNLGSKNSNGSLWYCLCTLAIS